MPVYTDWAVGDLVTADALNTNLVEERDGTQTLVADSTTYGVTETVIATVTITAVSGLVYKVEFKGKLSTDVALDASNLRIREDNLTGTLFGFNQIYLPTTTANGWAAAVYGEYTAVATGSKTFVMTGQKSIGAGTAHRIRAAATTPCFFIAEKVMN